MHCAWRSLLWVCVFTTGFVNLALEVVCPRVIATIYGSTQTGWAFGITVVLGGLALGYWMGGTIPAGRERRVLQVALLLGAVGTISARQVSWFVAEFLGNCGIGSIAGTTLATLALPSICFGLCPVLCLQLMLMQQGDSARPGALTGRVFAVSTCGSICGALAGAFIGVQILGIGTTLTCLAAILIMLAALLQVNRSVLAVGSVILGLAFYPGGVPSRAGMSLIETRESPWQTVQVLRSGAWTVMAFGPENQTVWHSENRQGAPYLVVLTEVARVHRVHDALIIGGAGNALGHMLEDLGLEVTVLELDPVVAEMAGRHFGSLKGRVLVGDGRIALRRHGIEPVDLLVLDAFCGPGIIPPHLLSVEAIEEYAAILRVGGILAINMHGAPAGESSQGVRVVCDTVASVFATTRIWPIQETTTQSTEWQNIWILASNAEGFSDGLPAVEGAGVPATDNLNPLEVLLTRLSMRAFAGQHLNSIWQMGR